jgi:hypothetical protein
MQKALVSALFVALLGGQLVAQAFASDPVRPLAPARAVAGGGLKASPLVRYLAATLQLSQSQAVAVQQAVQHHERLTRTPGQLAERLHPVLSAREYERFERLYDNASTAASLHELAQR